MISFMISITNVKRKKNKKLTYFANLYIFLVNFLKLSVIKVFSEQQTKAKKKYFVSKLARSFQTDAACVFLFFILFFFYFNWSLPPRTSKTKNDRKVLTSVFSEIKRDFTHFLSSHVLKFFQNSKLSSFFVVKMKKK